MLELRDVHVEIASAQVLRGLNLQVAKGQMVGLVGRNGAGKTSSLRSIMGHLTPRMGQILFDGQDLVLMPAHVRAGLGIGYMPEDRGLVPELTVEENIVLPLWVSPTLDLNQRLAWSMRSCPNSKPCLIGELCCCQAANKNWWRWPVPWLSAPGCCCWMSRLKAWRQLCRCAYQR
jgi:branched-chain amino acid transport system ATP-binding protein